MTNRNDELNLLFFQFLVLDGWDIYIFIIMNKLFNLAKVFIMNYFTEDF